MLSPLRFVMITSDKLTAYSVPGFKPVGTAIGKLMIVPALPDRGRLLIFTTTTLYLWLPRFLTDTVCSFIRDWLSVGAVLDERWNGSCRSNCSATTSSVFSRLTGISTSLP